jgi:hypothetical protein
MKFILNFLLILCFSSCTSSVDLQTVNLGPLFHDSNSKVWVIDQIISQGHDLAQHEKMNKDLLVFYENGKCLYQSMRTLGEMNGMKGEYMLDSKAKTLLLIFPKEKWDFVITYISEDLIELTSSKASSVKIKMVIVPFPEL